MRYSAYRMYAGCAAQSSRDNGTAEQTCHLTLIRHPKNQEKTTFKVHNPDFMSVTA